MTYLDTDKQTLADLNIVEGIYDEYPLYSLFSSTETKKGKHMMLHWISYPLSDMSAIQKRQEAIVWNKLPELPLDEDELDFVEYYLEYREQIRKPNALISLTSVLNRLLRHDAKRYVIERGVVLIIQLLNRLELLRRNLPQDAPSLLKEFAHSIQYTIYSNELEEVIKLYQDEEVHISSYAIDKYDYLFRYTYLEQIRELLAHIYTLDVCRSAHRIAISKGFCCCPKMTDTTDLSITDFVHPFIRGGRKNNWKMINGNICFFTGSNMAGKSTTLKAISIAVWLAHCGLPVPASSMTCPVLEGIYTSINLPDSLRDGRSHFLAEVLRIKEVLHKAKSGKRCLIILDEMFRGTNAHDAYDASITVNKIFKKFPHCLFLISTHIQEYAQYFQNDNTCCFYYMDSQIEKDQFICTHQLLKGISEVKVGYWLVKKELEDLL